MPELDLEATAVATATSSMSSLLVVVDEAASALSAASVPPDPVASLATTSQRMEAKDMKAVQADSAPSMDLDKHTVVQIR